MQQEIRRLETSGVPESPELNAYLTSVGTAPVKGSARMGDLLRRPQVKYENLRAYDPTRPDLPPDIQEEVEIQVKYAGYIQRQLKQVEQFQKEENRRLPLRYGLYENHGTSAGGSTEIERYSAPEYWAGVPSLRSQPGRFGGADDISGTSGKGESVMFYDTHAHFDDRAFDQDREELWKRFTGRVFL